MIQAFCTNSNCRAMLALRAHEVEAAVAVGRAREAEVCPVPADVASPLSVVRRRELRSEAREVQPLEPTERDQGVRRIDHAPTVVHGREQRS